MKAPNSINLNRMATQAMPTMRSMRRHNMGGITSLPAGKMVAIGAAGLLREDAVRSGRLRFSWEMMETAQVLMNPVNVRVMAYLVPFLAMERFNASMDQLNLSYQGQPPLEGEAVVPFIETAAMGTHAANPVYKYLGVHGKSTDNINTMYLEAYNAIWNFRAKNRSADLALRTRLQTDLAPAFWINEQFKHIVPSVDFDSIDGEVSLSLAGDLSEAQRYAKVVGTATLPTSQGGMRHIVTGNLLNAGTVRTDGGGRTTAGAADTAAYYDPMGTLRADLQSVMEELVAGGIKVSLANIELARKTQAFAKIRQQYNQHEDWVINLLMNGIQLPDQALKQPMLLADRTTIFGQSLRYATDAGNMTESVANGATFIDLAIQVPRIGTGGVVMIVAEVTPEQLYERQRDPFFHTTDHATWPEYLRDVLDPEKVDIVKNGEIDTSHATPDATFGYQPLNGRWNINVPRVGGKFYRPAVDAGTDEERQRIWAIETANQVLGEDFYLCKTPHQKPFVVTNQDPFEVVTEGSLFIEGNTVFGPHLIEASDDYEKVMAVAPVERIEQEEEE